MKTAICYYSRHHGNTLKILQAMASVGEIDLIDVTRTKSAQLADLRLRGLCFRHLRV